MLESAGTAGGKEKRDVTNEEMAAEAGVSEKTIRRARKGV